MTTFTAVVYEDIPANRLVGLKGVQGEGLDAGSIYLKKAEKDWIPDMVTSVNLIEGDTVQVTIANSPIWEAELSKDTRPGTLVSCDDDGKICATNTRDFKRHIGYSIEGGKAGDVIKYVRKTGTLDQALGNGLVDLIDDDEKV